MVQAEVRNTAGGVVSSTELDDRIFAVERNDTLIHQAVLRIQANRRAGTHDTKTRGQVSGTTAKMYRQKGTGRARHGAMTAPQFRKGGVVFGPHPRSYEQDMPKKMRRKALASVLSDKLREGRVLVVDGFPFEHPHTKSMIEVLGALGVSRRITIVIPAPDSNVQLSARNIPEVRTIVAHTLNIVDAIDADYLVFTQDGLRALAGLVNYWRSWACDCLPRGAPDGSARRLRSGTRRAGDPGRRRSGHRSVCRCHATAVAGLDNSRAVRALEGVLTGGSV